MAATDTRPSEYQEHLPGLFRKQTPEGLPNFLGQYLKIFEALLSGRDDAELGGKRIKGLEETISDYPGYLDAGLAPVDDAGAARYESDFLNYLAKWVALVFDQNWSLEKKRQWLQKIVSLYKKRGTKSGLTEYLHMFIDKDIRIDELSGGFIVGIEENSIVGLNTFIAGAPAYYFIVRFNYGFDPERFEIEPWKNMIKGITAIIDLEKPAHTYYKLDPRAPGIIIAERSTVGKDTLIWQESLKI